MINPSSSVDVGRYLEKPRKCSECKQDAWLYVVVSFATPKGPDDCEEHDIEVPICQQCLQEKLENVGA